MVFLFMFTQPWRIGRLRIRGFLTLRAHPRTTVVESRWTTRASCIKIFRELRVSRKPWLHRSVRKRRRDLNSAFWRHFQRRKSTCRTAAVTIDIIILILSTISLFYPFTHSCTQRDEFGSLDVATGSVVKFNTYKKGTHTINKILYFSWTYDAKFTKVYETNF